LKTIITISCKPFRKWQEWLLTNPTIGL